LCNEFFGFLFLKGEYWQKTPRGRGTEGVRGRKKIKRIRSVREREPLRMIQKIIH
jgi:hypothetical protein